MATGKNISIPIEEYQQFVQQKQELEQIRFELSELKRMLFGRKSERYVPTDPSQMSLFDLPEEAKSEVPLEQIEYTRRKGQEKKKPVRTELPAHLPRVEEFIEPENLPEGAKKIGESITETLEYKKAEIFVRRIVRSKYIVSQDDEHTEIAIAKLPKPVLAKSNAGASLLTYLIISKYVDHLPFYRQVKMFKRQGVELSESTINGWFAAVCSLMEPLYKLLVDKVLNCDYLMADETPINVLTKDKPKAAHKGYYWVYFNPLEKLLFFEYQKSRSGKAATSILEDFSGHLQTDDYVGYDAFNKRDNIYHMACMAHARRKFEHASAAYPQLAGEALKMFKALYEIERDARERGLDHGEIKALRQRESVWRLNILEAWLIEKQIKVLPQSSIGKAISYTYNLWPHLKLYVEDGRLQIDNNLVENSIRPIALGRKNYMFAGSHEGAQRAAMMYSFLGVCAAQKINLSVWLTNTLTKLPNCPDKDLHQLLPIAAKLQE